MLTNTWSSQIIQKNITGIRNFPTSNNNVCTNFNLPIESEDYSIPVNKYYASRNINSPKIEDNLDLNHLIFSLLGGDPYKVIRVITEEIDTNPDIINLGKEYNLEPFFTLTGRTTKEKVFISNIIEEIYSKGIECYYSCIIEDFLNKSLLGRNTRSKFGYLKKYHNQIDISNNLRSIISVIAQKLDTIDHVGVSEMLRNFIILLKMIEFGGAKVTHFCYHDIINSALGYISTFTINENILLSAQYTPRDPSYLLLGNIYGDCTAIQKIKQADDVKNIFWTKASWILNPFYQILEIQHQGKAVIKIHLLLAVFRGEIILCIDAIETSVGMREYTSNSEKKGTENINIDPIFHLRFEILENVMSIIKGIASNIGTETILIEEYSNTTWVRSWLQKYQQIYFYTHELHEINDGDIIDSIFYKESGKRILSGKKTEIQLLNTELQDKGLKTGVNSARVLMGSVGDILHPFRGI